MNRSELKRDIKKNLFFIDVNSNQIKSALTFSFHGEESIIGFVSFTNEKWWWHLHSKSIPARHSLSTSDDYTSQVKAEKALFKVAVTLLVDFYSKEIDNVFFDDLEEIYKEISNLNDTLCMKELKLNEDERRGFRIGMTYAYAYEGNFNRSPVDSNFVSIDSDGLKKYHKVLPILDSKNRWVSDSMVYSENKDTYLFSVKRLCRF